MALVHDAYGGPEVLKLATVPIPQPDHGQVLVRVHAAAINEWDQGLMRGKPLINRTGGLRRPRHRILGSDIAGVVDAVGAAVTRYRVGDEVFGDLSASGFGAFAQYAVAPETALTRKPSWLTFEQAAAIPQAGGLAIAGLRKTAPSGAGRRLLVNGAGGGVGTFAIQVAKAHGWDVTGVDGLAKLQAMRTLGADHTIDFRRVDFARTGEQYDLILDMVCSRSPLDYGRALRPRGVGAVIGGRTGRLAMAAAFGQTMRLAAGRRVSLVMYRANRTEDMALLLHLISERTVTPVIDREFDLAESPRAMRYYLQGDFVGKVVLRVRQER